MYHGRMNCREVEQVNSWLNKLGKRIVDSDRRVEINTDIYPKWQQSIYRIISVKLHMSLHRVAVMKIK